MRVLKSRFWLTIAAVFAALLWAAPASAYVVYTLDNGGSAFSGTNFGTVRLDQISPTDVRITVTLAPGEYFAGTGAGFALTWDIAKVSSPCSVASPCKDPQISFGTMPTGFAAMPYVAPTAQNPNPETYKASPFGDFNYAVDCTACQGGQTSNPSGPLVFDITLSSGLLIGNLITPSDFSQNAGGTLFAVDIYKPGCGSGACTGVVGTNGNNHVFVPEPTTSLVFGAGLIALAGLRRRKKTS